MTSIYAVIGTEDEVVVSNNEIEPVLGLPSVDISPGTYSNVTAKIDQFGRIVSIQSGDIGPAPVTVTPGEVSLSALNLGLADSGVTSGSYVQAKITVDSKGRITSVENAPYPAVWPSSKGGTGLSTLSGQSFKLLATPASPTGTALVPLTMPTTSTSYVPLRTYTAGTLPNFGSSNAAAPFPVSMGGNGQSGASWSKYALLHSFSDGLSIRSIPSIGFNITGSFFVGRAPGDSAATSPVMTMGNASGVQGKFYNQGNCGVLCAGSSSTTGMQLSLPNANTTYVLTSNGPDTIPTYQPLTTAATAADQVLGTSTSLKVMPGNQKSHQSAAKAWCRFTVVGTTVTNAVNFGFSATITRSSAGVFVLTFSTAFNAANYIVQCTAMGIDTTSTNQPIVAVRAMTTTTITITSVLPGGGFTDFPEYYVIAYGTQ